ncbi:MAG: hypothetical protein HYZ00_14290 [Candidatus Hydrogenedentes bacterium]|nr:hypothetical protein [Candidatus Hydrogenedentota bacterium]
MGKIDFLVVHQISEDELSTLAKGSPDSLLLNFAIGLISTATSFFVALCTTTISSDRMYQAFFMITLVGYIAGIVLFTRWWKTHKSVGDLVERIRNRVSPEGESRTLGPGDTKNAPPPGV